MTVAYPSPSPPEPLPSALLSPLAASLPSLLLLSQQQVDASSFATLQRAMALKGEEEEEEEREKGLDEAVAEAVRQAGEDRMRALEAGERMMPFKAP